MPQIAPQGLFFRGIVKPFPYLFPAFYRGLVLLLCCLVWGNSRAQAHPHVWVDSFLSIRFDTQGLAGLELVWQFDEVYSSAMVMDYDANRNRKLDPAEAKGLAQLMGNNLKKFHYFIEVQEQGTPLPLAPTELEVRFYQKKILLRALFPLARPLQTQHTELVLANFDPEYYSDFRLKTNEVRLVGADAFAVKLTAESKIVPNPTWGDAKYEAVRISLGPR